MDLNSSEQGWMALPTSSGSASVVHVDLRPCQGRERKALAWLDEAELSRWRRFKRPCPQREFTLCRAALRSILCSQLGCANSALSFGTARCGKPFALVDGVRAPIGFNVSHSGSHGLFTFVSNGEVGVDVEERLPLGRIEGIDQIVFSASESSVLAAACEEQKVRLFFRMWTMKEALIKALGTGFSLDMRRFEIPKAMRNGVRKGHFRIPQCPEFKWGLENIGNDTYAVALAYSLESDLSERKKDPLFRP